MAIPMELRENDRVIYYYVAFPSRLSELTPLKEQNQAVRDQHPYTIHVIANLTEIRMLPSDILSLRRGSPNIDHPRAGFVFLVTTSSYVRSIVGIFTPSANRNKLRVVGLREQAWIAQ